MYNKRILIDDSREFEILSSWGTDYGDIKYNCLLYEDLKEMANVVISLDIPDINEEKQIEEVKDYLESSFDDYVNLPKISECSPLLQEIYESTFNDAEMCHIDKEDWLNFYEEQYTNEDIENLRKEVEKYNLDTVLEIGDLDSNCEYFIVGYGDLNTRFNDDRNIEKESEMEL